MNKWVGKLALVTGATVGIGFSICEKLVKQGVNVVGCGRNIEKLKEHEKKWGEEKGKFYPMKCDLRKEEEILSMFKLINEKFRVLHICINNAGLVYGASLLEGDTNQWREMYDVNVLALCIVTRESVALMRANNVNDGHIININSTSGHNVCTFAMYCGTKFAITALTEGLRRELRGINSNIRSTSVSPGQVETEVLYRAYPNNPEIAHKTYASIDCLQGSDIADGVIFALSAPAHMDVNEVTIRPVEQIN